MLTLKQRFQVVQELYLADERPWLVAFSGGKDSTALLQLIWHGLQKLAPGKRQKPVHVCYVDTGVEQPAYEKHVRSILGAIAAAAQSQSMPMAVRILEPELKHRFFVAVIGRGYAPPTHWFRWCMKGMRIRPMSSFIRHQISASGAVVIALGLRRAESQARTNVLKSYSTERPFIGRYGSLRGAVAFTPIEDFDVADVWQFLMKVPCPWGGDNRVLMQLYSQAAGGECPSYSLGGGMGPVVVALDSVVGPVPSCERTNQELPWRMKTIASKGWWHFAIGWQKCVTICTAAGRYAEMENQGPVL